MWAAAAALAAAVLGGEPECSPMQYSCPFTAVNVRFGNGFIRLSQQGARRPDMFADGEVREVCSPENWAVGNTCFSTACALRLQVTDPPEYRGLSLCMQDNSFQPYEMNGHMSKHHPLNGVELDLVAVGGALPSSTRFGCVAEDFDVGARNFSGKLAILSRGGCFFYRKFENALAAGAVAGIMVNNHLAYPVLDQIVVMAGDSTKLADFPAAAMPRHYGLEIFKALDRGVPLRGKMVFSCEKPPAAAAADPAVAASTGCPDPRLRTVCHNQLDDSRRLCAACPLQYRIPAAGNLTVCLYPNKLLPPKAATFLELARGAPWTTEDHVVYLPRGIDVCAAGTFEGLAGKVLLFELPEASNCLPYEAVRHAQGHDVAGVVFFMPPTFTATEMAEGLSFFITIPVHSISHEHARNLTALETLPGAAALQFGPGRQLTGYVLPSGLVYRGDLPPSTAPPAAVEQRDAAEAVSAEAVGFAWSPLVIGCIAAIVLLSLCVVGKFVHGRMITVDIPEAVEGGAADRFTVPLAAASMALSLTLLIVIAATAFWLAYTAGEESMRDAVDSGKEATQDTYSNAVFNVDNLASQLRLSTIERVKEGFGNLIGDGERLALSTATLFIELDGTWGAFDAKVNDFVGFLRSAGNADYVVSIWTRPDEATGTGGGFFASRDFKTDDWTWRENYADMQNRSVAATHDGTLYETAIYTYDAVRKLPQYWYSVPRDRYIPERMLAAGAGDPHSMIAGRPDQYRRWYLSTTTFPNLFSDSNIVGSDVGLSMSVFTPVFNRSSTWVGTVEARVGLATIGTVISNGIGGDLAANLTVVVFDLNSRKLMGVTGDNESSTTKHIGMYTNAAAQLEDANELFTLSNGPSVLLNAFGAVLDAQNVMQANATQALADVEGNPNQLILSTNFDQRDYYQRPDPYASTFFTLMPDDGGHVVDTSGHATRARVRGGQCGDCFMRDGAARAMALDGESTLYIDLNLTTDAPEVRATRIPTADGSWLSSNEYYKRILPIDGTNSTVWCPALPVPGRPGMNRCMLREKVLDQSYSITVRVKPDADVPSALTPDTPRLFSTDAAGDARVRWFANGQFNLNTQRYGCEAGPMKDGLPGGAWTTLTAVVRTETRWRRDRTCRVYANGTLVSEGLVTVMFSSEPRAMAWVVGQGLRGLVSYVSFEKLPMVVEEVASLHAHLVGGVVGRADRPDFKRHVPSREWYVDVSIAATEPGQQDLINRAVAGVAALLPRDDVMRRVDRNNEITTLNLAVKEANTVARLDQRTHEAIFVILVIALVSVLLFLIFNDMITAPFSSIAVVLMEAAVMKIDTVPECDTFLTEIGAIRRAMTIMVSNLKEYRSYMPQHLMVEDMEMCMDLDGNPDVSDDDHTVAGRRSVAFTHDGPTMSSVASAAFSGALSGGMCSPDVEEVESEGEKSRGTSVVPDGSGSTLENPLEPAAMRAGALGSSSRLSPGLLANQGSQASMPLTSPGSSKSVLRNHSSGMARDSSNPGVLTLTAGALAVRGYNKDDVGEDASSMGSRERSGFAEELSAVSADSSRRTPRRRSVLSPKAAASSQYAKRTAKIAQGHGKELLSVSLTNKRVTFCAINIVGFHDVLERAKSLHAFINLHAAMVSRVCSAVNQTRGVPDSFSGDRFLASFNATKINLLHEEAACNCVHRLLETVAASETLADQKLSIGVASGEAKVGNMGSEHMKRFNFLTPVLGFAMATERIARKQNIAALCDHAVYHGAQGRHYFLFVDRVLFPKLQHRPVALAQLRESAARVGGDEWMYELQQKEQKNPYNEWNAFFQAVVEGRWEIASASHAGALALSRVDPVAGQHYPDLHKLYEAKEGHLPPIELPYA